jgi:hypothetical protein
MRACQEDRAGLSLLLRFISSESKASPRGLRTQIVSPHAQQRPATSHGARVGMLAGAGMAAESAVYRAKLETPTHCRTRARPRLPLWSLRLLSPGSGAFLGDFGARATPCSGPSPARDPGRNLPSRTTVASAWRCRRGRPSRRRRRRTCPTRRRLSPVQRLGGQPRRRQGQARRRANASRRERTRRRNRAMPPHRPAWNCEHTSCRLATRPRRRARPRHQPPPDRPARRARQQKVRGQEPGQQTSRHQQRHRLSPRPPSSRP